MENLKAVKLDEHVDASIDCIHVRTEEIFCILHRVYIEKSFTLKKAIENDVFRKKSLIDSYRGKINNELLKSLINQYTKYIPYYNVLLNKHRTNN